MGIKTELQSNNIDLRSLLGQINTLPEQENLDTEVNEQTNLLAQLQEILSGKAAGVNAFGYIIVTYPVGSNCAVVLNDELNAGNTTNGIMATTTDGFYVFPVPSAGDWWIGCWTGDDPMNAPEWDNTVVTINANNRYAMVELTYNLMLYDNGNQCTAATGGWKVQNGSNANSAINSNNIYIGFINTGTSGGGHAAHTINKVALSGYNTLKATLNVTHLESSNKIQFGVVETANRTGNSFVANTSIGTIGEQTVSVDISSYNNGSYYVIFEGIYTRATISKVWLEP